MLDNQLIQLIISIIKNGAAGAGVPGLIVKAAFQPTRQGVEVAPTVYLSKISDKRLGFPYSKNTWGTTVQSVFTGSIASNVLTVSAVASGALAVGQTLSGASIDSGVLWIASLGTGSGGTGTYNLNQPFTLSSQTISGILGMKNQITQQYETTFQITCLATQNPATPNQYTAADILNAVAYIMQNDVTIATLEAQNVGILRVTDVRNAPFVDDRDRFEYGPSFDFTLTHKQIISATQPIISSEEVDIYGV